ncbi:copper amine oxidase N-terminal domain-containing protein [Brevibacillus fulvus]|uniref:Copper amine oxidase-like N-terminal domain-containing protein n=1 Tax=Brevibacillus fulvus TaxID=1125967 RepID=A0A938Y374_9BACL|nr:copper amine oxidase N-terminal domain-containing protein [Brevibacillus fulvus]MBM7591524.1 hypothetical protein [Brevibacillus fulvus]
MKKMISASMAALLVVSAVPAAFAKVSVEAGAKVTVAKADKGKGGSDKGNSGSDKGNSGSDKGNSGSDKGNSGSDKGNSGSDKDKKGSETTEQASPTDSVDETDAAETDTEAAEETDAADETDVADEADAISDQEEATISSKVKEAVKTKKSLIELRQQLKKAKQVTPELQATYEQLVDSLEQTADLPQALEVQKELLVKTYQASAASSTEATAEVGEEADTAELYEKLGELYEKAGVEGIKTFVNGQEPQFDVKPFVQGGRAMVPVRAISAALKADVQYAADTRTAVISRGDVEITLYLDKSEAEVNGQTVALDTKPVVKNGRLFLPLRFISEQLNAKVAYQPEGDVIVIEDPSAEDAEQTGDDAAETGTGSDADTAADNADTTDTADAEAASEENSETAEADAETAADTVDEATETDATAADETVTPPASAEPAADSDSETADTADTQNNTEPTAAN